MVRRLERAGIAHGDLQHGNVLVDEDGRLRLVDYDAMYVPALHGKRSPEVGHQNYQHPDRDEQPFGPAMDRFSALVIDTALLAVILLPELWERYSTGENLLFRAADFQDPDASSLFNDLMQGPDELRRQADVLRRACWAGPEDAPSLDEIAAGDVVFASSTGRRAVRTARGGAEGAYRSNVETWFARVVVAIALAAAALAVAGQAAAAGALLVAGTVTAVLFAAWKHRRMPPVRRRRRLAKESAYYARLVRSLEDELVRAERARADFVEDRASAYERRLEEVRDEALRDRLKYHFIGEAREFEGITQKAVVRLKLEGIRTAYQASPDRVEGILQLTDATKARINMWRGGLASEYESDLPTSLSPAEERRVKRRIEVRLEAIDEELARMRSRIRAQQAEYDEIQTRMNGMDEITLPRYMLHLLRIGNMRRRDEI